MASNSDVKIRVLPRSTDARSGGVPIDSKSHPKRRSWSRPSNRVLLGSAAMVVAALSLGLALNTPATHQTLASHTPARDAVQLKISKLVEDVKLKEEILRQRRQIENLRSTSPTEVVDVAGTAPELQRSYGVQMDSENTADQLYQELNDRPRARTEMTPDERINAMLEKNKWLNQQEREERVNYVRNFIKTAYDRGYEVDLDQNLRVVGVRPVANRRVSIDQVMEKVSRREF